MYVYRLAFHRASMRYLVLCHSHVPNPTRNHIAINVVMVLKMYASIVGTGREYDGSLALSASHMMAAAKIEKARTYQT